MPLYLLHRLRNSLNWVLMPAGFALERAPKRRWHLKNSIVSTKVGRYMVDFPGVNHLSWLYVAYPTIAGELGRLAAIIRDKYPQLAVIDVGANVGDTACIVKTAADVPVLCIEGDGKTFEYLLRNIRQLSNTAAHQLFLGETTGVITGSFSKTGWNTTITPGSGAAPGELIKIVRLDEFIATQPGWENYKLLKIDTEGFDCAIIRGSTGYLRRAAPVLYFEYNRENMDAIGERGLDTLFGLQELGYSHITFHDNAGRLVTATKLSERQTIQDLHEYADGKNAEIYFYDLTVFHEQDADLAVKYAAMERGRRNVSAT